ncbi:heme-copper oxidase subunit III [Accumulibacter sp.]|uniref:cytochrome c oxidase subunit 3 n=1 Tax=Accumulibacter sp. TaxID=2053492 RepID=UPI002D18022D|nr:heme-copper oxidase subunit III [Accumulibacter sp.]HMW63434.1 heme-copper oxidase subunit III [Accumulibacter sp.]HMW79128.1 heme-copper oxidase subunit III [Accumulibacter sp.]HNB66907.1 heme-copper oxidase subunit III [Accumulibacter sp.]HNC26691.1 heme-copper oxidase subunit III [Accumulibacter sp.]HNH91053.1 heme-copper oxidase subunit III [Accumulibacter sp.]
MSQHHVAHHDAHHGGHHAHWDTSVWPAVISIGILAWSLAFSFHFVYHQSFAGLITFGLGLPLILAGIAGWTSEAMGKGEGLSFGAMGWFILAEAMIFMSFFAYYWFMRLNSPVWPPAGTPELPVVYPLVMTAVLVGSSITIHAAEHQMDLGNKSGFLTWLVVTIVLGLTFLGMSVYEWTHLIHGGFTIATNSFGTTFYSITGLHGSHVVVGLAIFLAGLLPALRGNISHGFWRTASLYWHFVDVIWFFVVSQVYFW